MLNISAFQRSPGFLQDCPTPHLFSLDGIVEPEGSDEPLALDPGLLGQRRLLGGAEQVGHPARQRVLDLAPVLGDRLTPTGHVLVVGLTPLNIS